MPPTIKQEDGEPMPRTKGTKSVKEEKGGEAHSERMNFVRLQQFDFSRFEEENRYVSFRGDPSRKTIVGKVGLNTRILNVIC